VSTKKPIDPHDALRDCRIHISQITAAIAETEAQRCAAVVEGDLELVRRHNKRIADLKGDLDALQQGRQLFEAQVTKLDSEQRIAACDQASEELKPYLDKVCAALEQTEDRLIEAGAAFNDALNLYEEFNTARSVRVAILPKAEPWRASFSLDVWRACLTETFESFSKGRGDLAKIAWYITEWHKGRWSATARRRADEYIANLKSVVREIEEDRAAAKSGEAIND
jgi:hypothetical protein